eukprot:CAMPEP_0182468070 /NCGR_PEP_ID=MMETSP1319-20130603/14923_1 /TAXON_ID=172717 /ORGANISM="Bolidomonas pacifica, Strain RCC208" /LENGTH=376 /DNA_ID=CAMNT_0024668233 /DNA_START=184 /DNA_END=1311 /DNA_ORIENTATION=+
MSIVVFEAPLHSTPDIGLVRSRYVSSASSAPQNSTAVADQEAEVVGGDDGNDDDDDDGDDEGDGDSNPDSGGGGNEMDVDDKGAADKKGGEGDGASQQQGKSASPSEQPPPRKKKKPAPPPLLAPSNFPSFTDYLFAKYSSGLPGGDEDEDGSEGSYQGSVYKEGGSEFGDFVDDDDLKDEVENELGPQNDKDGAADNPEGADDFRVDMLKPASPKKMGRPANEAVAGDVEKLTERYALAKETKDEAFASLRELLKFPEPTAVHVPIPEDIGPKREVKFDHERLGSKVVKVPEGVVGSWATSLYPSCDYTIAEKKALHDYSVTYDDFVNVEAEYAKKIMKNKGEFKGYKKREVLAKKWRDLGDEKVCANVVKLWKE